MSFLCNNHQTQIAELFGTSLLNANIHITFVLKDKELDVNSVVKYYLTTDTDTIVYYMVDCTKKL